MSASEKGLFNFNIRDLIWLITIVAVACGVWMHGQQKERAALDRVRAAREELATTQLLVQQVEAESAQRAAHAKLQLAEIKHELVSAQDKLKRQEYSKEKSSDVTSDQE